MGLQVSSDEYILYTGDKFGQGMVKPSASRLS